MVLDASLLSTQHYKVRIKGKVEQSRKGVAPSPTHWCSSYRKGSLRVTLDYGRQLFTFIETNSKSKHYTIQQYRRSSNKVVMYTQKLHPFCNTSSLMMTQSRAEGTCEINNYGKFINQFQPNIIKSIRRFERIKKKYVDKNVYYVQSNIYIYIYKENFGRSSVSTTETDIDTWLANAWTAINRLSVIWKSDLTNKMKRSFFSAAIMSILLYRCTTWMLTKRLEKRLDGNSTRMLQAILNKSWRQHPTKQQLHGHLPPITKTIKVIY